MTLAELPPGPDARPAAVLCLVHEEDGQAHVVLTRRARYLKDHPGEISFPGGRLGPGEQPVMAALREAYEEIAVPPSSVTLLGQLTPLTTRRSSALVRCFVGTFEGPASVPGGLVASQEVERVFSVRLVDLLAPGIYHQELWPVRGHYHRVCFFDLGDDILWGATGRLVEELLCLVLGVGLPSPAGEGSLEEP